MGIRMTAMFLAAVLAAGTMQDLYAQGTYVSKPLADAMKAGKFYMKASSDNEVGATYEIAVRGDVSMSRATMPGRTVVTLGTEDYSYILDEKKKTWQGNPNNSSEGDFSHIRFVSQGTCRVNGADGWYYDKYSANSQDIIFYYNSSKVSIIELGGGMNELGPMSLQSFSSTIPSNMYFCVGNDWKPASGGGAAAAGGIDKSAIEKQIRESLKGQKLPPGMTVDSMVEMAMSRMGGVAAKAAPSSTPEPPKCSKPWQDSGSVVELAAGNTSARLTISDRRPLDKPVFASAFSAPASSLHRTDLDVTNEGIHAALLSLKEQFAGMSDEEVMRTILNYNNDMMLAFRGGCVTGDMIEAAVARCLIYPDALTYNNTGLLFLYKDDPQTALTYFKPALEMAPDNEIILANLAESFFDVGDYTAARKYAERCLAIEPEYGAAQQVLTSIYFLEGNYDKGFTSLLKTARNFFTDITASQFMSVWTSIQEIASRGPQGEQIKPLLDRIYTKENLDLLTEATKSGFEYNYQELVQDPLSYPWPLEDKNCQYAYKYFGKCSQLQAQFQNRLSSERNACMKEKKGLIDLYLMMGSGNTVSDMTSLQSSIQKRVKYAKVDITSSLPDQSVIDNAYITASKLCAGNSDGNILFDARQFWCLMLWDQYMGLRLDYADGDLAGSEDGVLTGTYMEGYKVMLDKLSQADRMLKAADEKRNSQAEKLSNERFDELRELESRSASMKSEAYEAARKGIDRKYLQALVPVYKTWNNECSQLEKIKMSARKDYYMKELRPAMEEYWLKMFSMTSYCHDQNVIKYFLNKVMVEDSRIVESVYDFGYSTGLNMSTRFQTYKQIAEEAGVTIQELEKEISELNATVAQQSKLPGGTSKDPGELGVGVDLITFQLKASVNGDGEFIFEYTNRLDGYVDSFNLTNGSYTSKETFLTLADEKRGVKSEAEIARKNLEDFVGDKAIGAIADVVPGGKLLKIPYDVAKAADSFGAESNTRRYAVTQDAAGNKTGSGAEYTHTKSYSYDDATLTVGHTDRMSGNCVSRKYHIRASYKLFFAEGTK